MNDTLYLIVNATVNDGNNTPTLQNEYNFSNFLDSNVTSSDETWRQQINAAFEYFILFLVILMMLSMGCDICWKNVLTHLRRPIPLMLGMAMQFVFLPLFSFTLLTISNVKNQHAISVLIISCCPGGVLSNSLTYLADGDLSLSIAMTSVSTIIAMGMLPANSWIYCRQFESGTIVVPYKKMAFSVVLITVPALMGMLLKWKFPRVGQWFAKIGTAIGVIFILSGLVFQFALNYHQFAMIPFKLHVILLLLPITGFSISYGFATLTNQNPAIRKAIGFEVGVQNIPLALTIIYLSFPQEIEEEMVVIPFMFACMVIISGSLMCFVFKLRARCKRRIEQYKKAPISNEEDI